MGEHNNTGFTAYPEPLKAQGISTCEDIHRVMMSLLIRYSLIPYYFHLSITSLHRWSSTTHPVRASMITHLCFIRPALLIWWTYDLWFTCFIAILSYPMCALLQPDQSWIIMLQSQALTIASLQMSLLKPQVCTRSPRWRIRWYTR